MKHKTCNLRELLCPELSKNVSFPANLHLVFLTVTPAKVKEIQISPAASHSKNARAENFLSRKQAQFCL
jgi:hypothetical protein